MDTLTSIFLILAVLGALGAVPVIFLAGRWVWRRWRGQPDPSPATKDDLARVERAVHELRTQLSTYVDGLLQAKDEVRDPSEEGLRLQHAEEYEAAIAEFQKAFAAAEDDSQRCALQILIGNSLRYLDRPAEAEGHYRQAVETAQKAQDKEGEAFALGSLAFTYEDLRQPERGEDYYERSLAGFEETGDRESQVLILTHLSARSLERGQRRRAKAFAERAVALHPLQPGYEDATFLSLAMLGRVCELLDDPNEASRLYAEALRVADASEVDASSDPAVAAVLPAVRQALARLAATGPSRPKRRPKKAPPKP